MNVAGLKQRSAFAENLVSVAILAGMMLVPLVEFVGRPFGFGIPGGAPLVQHLTLWVAFLGASLAARSDALLRLSTPDLLPERGRRAARIVSSIVAVAVGGWLLVASADLVRIFFDVDDQVALGIPRWVALIALPVGFLLITVRLAVHASPRLGDRALAFAGLLLPLGLVWMAEPAETPVLFPGILLLVVATVLGMPIFAALGGAALLLFWNDFTVARAVPLNAYALASDDYLPAIPLFTLGGYLLAEGGAGQRLMRTFSSLLGWIPGGLAIAVTLILAFFTPLTGASGVTILSLGGLFFPMLTRARYPEATSLGLVTVSGSIGLLLPPSLPVILYGVYAGVSIRDLFVGALVPGVLLIVVVAGWSAFRGWQAGSQHTVFEPAEAASAVWQAKWELLLPVVLLGGYFGGYFASLVEAAAVTAAYALIVECFVYRDLSVRRDLVRVAVDCAALVGSFFIILCMALAFNNFLVTMEVPIAAVDWVESRIDSPIVFLLALNVLLIIVGALMDIYSAIFVIVPLIAPMGLAYGIHPVHLGVIFLANMELGYLMPPMGENLFLSAMRFKKPLWAIYRSTLPYLLLLVAVVLLITYVPGLSLWFINP